MIGLDLYQMFGLPDFASIDDVKKSYRQLAMKHHPDRGGNPEMMKKINEAMEVFEKDKYKYDSWLRQVRAQQGAPGVRIIIQEVHPSPSQWTTATASNPSTEFSYEIIEEAWRKMREAWGI